MSKPILAVLGAALAGAVLALGTAVESSAAQAGADITSAAAADKAIREVFATPDPYQRAARLAELMPRVGPGGLRAFPRILDDDLLSVGGTEALILLRRWVELAPDEAYRWGTRRTGLDLRSAAISLVVEERAKVDPKGTLQAIGVGDPVVQVALVRGWFASGDPGLEPYIVNLGRGFERQRALWVYAIESVRRDGPEATARWAESIPDDEDPRYKLNAYRQVGRALTAHDPAQGVAWCQKHCNGPHGDGVMAFVSREWAKQDGAATLTWLSKAAPPGREGRLAMTDAFRIWRQNDEEGMERWMLAQGPEDLEAWLQPVADRFAIYLSSKDPLAALEWAAVVEDQEARNNAYVTVARRWRVKDPKAAEAWLKTSPLPAEKRALVLEKNMPKAPPARPKKRGGEEELDDADDMEAEAAS